MPVLPCLGQGRVLRAFNSCEIHGRMMSTSVTRTRLRPIATINGTGVLLMILPPRILHRLSSHNWNCTWKTMIVLCITAGSDPRFSCRLLWTCLSCHQFRTSQHHLILAHRRTSSDRVMRASLPMLRLSRNPMASLSLLPYSSQPTFSLK